MNLIMNIISWALWNIRDLEYKLDVFLIETVIRVNILMSYLVKVV